MTVDTKKRDAAIDHNTQKAIAAFRDAQGAAAGIQDNNARLAVQRLIEAVAGFNGYRLARTLGYADYEDPWEEVEV